MAKQIINVGDEANDGTGDPIRSAMVKTNANFTELYGDVSDLKTGGAGYDDAAVSAHLNVVGASSDQVLSWSGTDFTWVDQSAVVGGGSFANTDIDLHLNTSTATTNQVLAWSGSDYDWVNAGSPLSSRTAPTGTTSSLANTASADLNIAGFKSYALLTITTDRAAWVRIYANGASRTADASRSETTDPAPDAGVIAEIITTGAQTVLVSPGVIGYNLESTPTTNIPCRVTNKSGAASTVTVTLNLLQLEA